jgi:FAD/FMN-containing dehydrogenase
MEPLDRLRAASPSGRFTTDVSELEAAGRDALRASRGRPELAGLFTRPLALVEPTSVAELAALVRAAAAAGVTLVARGGGSGLMGGAAVMSKAVVLDLRRLDAVTVLPEACLVRAGAGATLARVDEALAAHGLMLGHDPWTVHVATVGGALSTAGLGYLGARAGGIAAQLRALEVVLADGSIVRTRPSPARATGLDLNHLFVGTEGTLGIITEATLLVLPVPEERVVRAYRLPSFTTGVTIAAAFRRQGIRLACLELAAEGVEAGDAALLLVFDGLAGEARLHAERAAAILHGAGAIARSEEEAEAQWNGRHDIADAWAENRRTRSGEFPPDGRQFDYAHVGVPLAGLEAVRGVTHALVRRHGLRLIEEGLWHWPELYSVALSGPADAAAGVRATIEGICQAAQDAGGTSEYCHGVGWKLAHLMEREHGDAGLAVLRRVKAALDPQGILNPGKGGS